MFKTTQYSARRQALYINFDERNRIYPDDGGYDDRSCSIGDFRNITKLFRGVVGDLGLSKIFVEQNSPIPIVIASFGLEKYYTCDTRYQHETRQTFSLQRLGSDKNVCQDPGWPLTHIINLAAILDVAYILGISLCGLLFFFLNKTL